MTDKSPKKRSSTSDLFESVMSKLDRIDERLESIETQQTLTAAAYQRQGTLLEEVNKRCMAKLGLKCPLVDNEEEESERSNNDVATEGANDASP
jgi:hypothetical protein